NGLTDAVTLQAGTNVTLTPSGNKLTIAAQTSGGWTDNGSVVRLSNSTDLVGIGTTAPGEKLDVNGNIRISNAALSKAGRMGGDALGLWLEPSETNSSIRLNANPSRVGLYVRGTDGNIGIGTTTP